MRVKSKGPSVFLSPVSRLHCAGQEKPAHVAHSVPLIQGLLARLVVQVIEVKFAKLDLEPDMYCRYDYVALFNGGEKDNSRRIGKFCGDTAPG